MYTYWIGTNRPGTVIYIVAFPIECKRFFVQTEATVQVFRFYDNDHNPQRIESWKEV